MSDFSDVCSFFINGWCRHSDNCHFKHVRPTPSADSKTTVDVDRNQMPCWYMMENGRCPYGSSCYYSHELANHISSQRQTNPKVAKNACIFFAKGHCQRGDDCEYRHDGPDKEGGSESLLLADFFPKNLVPRSQQQNKMNRRRDKRTKGDNMDSKCDNESETRQTSKPSRVKPRSSGLPPSDDVRFDKSFSAEQNKTSSSNGVANSSGSKCDTQHADHVRGNSRNYNHRNRGNFNQGRSANFNCQEFNPNRRYDYRKKPSSNYRNKSASHKNQKSFQGDQSEMLVQAAKGISNLQVTEHGVESGSVVESASSSLQPLPQQPNEGKEEAVESIPVAKSTVPIVQRPVMSRFTEHNSCQLCDLTDEVIAKLNENERSQLKRRFTKDKLTISVVNNLDHFQLIFSSSNPDWPYDVAEITMDIVFPASYPREQVKVCVDGSEFLPKALIDLLNVSITEWITSKHEKVIAEGRVELYFREFLRWLDRNLEDLFTQGLIKYKEELSIKFPASAETPANLESSDESVGKELSESSCEENEVTEVNQEVQKPAASNHPRCLLDPVRKGCEVYLRNLQLLDGASTLWLTQLQLLLRCLRCRLHQDCLIKGTRTSALATSCSRCNTEMLVLFRPALLHPFTFVAGFLDLVGCRVDDVLFNGCKAAITCSQCEKEVVFEHLQGSTVNTKRCFGCHSKLSVAFDGVRFTQISPADEFDASQAKRVVVKKVKKPADQLFQEGKPLPDEGSCKHYKRSHRWLRFPCCGRAFPCDVCHEEAVNNDHEMILAHRMICGYCSKEQAFSQERPCVSCHKYMTKNKSSHWEGGKGCREKTTMSRNDPRKYANSNAKTVSRKSVTTAGKKT